MKIFFKALFLLGTTGLILGGCDPEELVEDFTTITVSTDLPQTFSVAITETDPTEITITKTIKASDNQEVEQFGSKIDSYEVDSLTLHITNYQGGDIHMTDLSMTFKNAAQENIVDPIVLISPGNLVNLPEYSNNGTIMTFTFDKATADAVANSFKADNELTIEMLAAIDGKPASFDIEAILYVKVEGKVMKMQ